MSQAKLAQVTGINKAIISQWLRGQYTGDIAGVEQVLEEYLRTAVEHEQAQDKAITYGSTQDYIPTSISEDIYNLIRYCQLAKGIAIAHATPGSVRPRPRGSTLRITPHRAITSRSRRAWGQVLISCASWRGNSKSPTTQTRCSSTPTCTPSSTVVIRSSSSMRPSISSTRQSRRSGTFAILIGTRRDRTDRQL